MPANHSIKTLIGLWESFADTPVNDNEEIEQPFLYFEKGTHRNDVWHWFEGQNLNFSIGRLQEGHVVYVVGYDSEGSGGFDWYYTEKDALKAFSKEKEAVAKFADEGYTAYYFQAIVSTYDEDISVCEIDSCLDDLFISADKVYGANPRYGHLRKNCIAQLKQLPGNNDHNIVVVRPVRLVPDDELMDDDRDVPLETEITVDANIPDSQLADAALDIYHSQVSVADVGSFEFECWKDGLLLSKSPDHEPYSLADKGEAH